MRTTVRLDEDLLRRAKIRAAEEGVTLTALIERGLERVLAGEQRGKGVREESVVFTTEAEETRPSDNPLRSYQPPELPDDRSWEQELRRLTGSDLPSDWLKYLDEMELRERYGDGETND